jgi:hypothetical protein
MLVMLTRSRRRVGRVPSLCHSPARRHNTLRGTRVAWASTTCSATLTTTASGDLEVVREALALVLQALIEAEAAEQIGAVRYERSATRTTHRNGSRTRLLSTKAGDVELKIPKLREGSFFPSLLEPRRRIDRALLAVVMRPMCTAPPPARSTTWSRPWAWGIVQEAAQTAKRHPMFAGPTASWPAARHRIADGPDGLTTGAPAAHERRPAWHPPRVPALAAAGAALVTALTAATAADPDGGPSTRDEPGWRQPQPRPQCQPAPGFLLERGRFKPIAIARGLENLAPQGIAPFGINDRGQIVGFAVNPEDLASPPTANTAPMGRMS